MFKLLLRAKTHPIGVYDSLLRGIWLFAARDDDEEVRIGQSWS